MKIRIFWIVLLLVGCDVSTSQVVTVGHNTYMVSSRVRGALTSWDEVKKAAVQKASNHCESMGRGMAYFEIETHGISGLSPIEVGVTFTCGPIS